MMSATQAVLSVEDLHTSFRTDGGTVRAVNGVSLELRSGERLAVVGESGSGKSAMALSLTRLISYPGRIDSGRVIFGGKDLLSMSESAMNRIRGGEIGCVFQDPMTSLDPVMRIADQMVKPIQRHLGISAHAAKRRAVEVLDSVGIPDPQERIARYPFELSGGMRQRVLIAMALSCNPRLIIADEPTTALDVTIQAQIVELLKEITARTGSSMLFITHDMGLVARFAQRVAVMYAGKIVETGTAEQIFSSPKHPYTQSLLRTIPSLNGPRPERLAQISGFPPDMSKAITGCSFRERCPIAQARCAQESPELTRRGEGHYAACWAQDGIPDDWYPALESAPSPENAVSLGAPVLEVFKLTKHFRSSKGAFAKKGPDIKAVNGIDLVVRSGETLGLVGESGCGKSTTARLLLNLEVPTDGDVMVVKRGIAHMGGDELLEYRKKVQMIFQDPYSSFNPKMSVEQIVTEPLDVLKIGAKKERRERARELIRQVGLEASFLVRYPSQLSGGQRQRVAIARALALSPSVIVADEPTSALDVSVRAQVINLLRDLKREMGVSFVFISHDLSTVRFISDTIAVMYLGEVVEYGPAEAVFGDPLHPYTKALLHAVPIPDPGVEAKRESTVLHGDLPSPANPPSGCPFHTRCPIATELCRTTKPVLKTHGRRKAACHYVA